MQIGVIGPGSCPPDVEALAEEVGREVARRGAVLVCGGLGGVMRGAARGARAEDGLTRTEPSSPSTSATSPARAHA